MKDLLTNDLVTVVQSLKKYYKLENEHKTNLDLDSILESKKPKHIVFVCLDGLGYSLLNKTPFLNSKCVEKIDSVFPPTTACATISIQTGLYPCEHGWIGWAQYFEKYDAVIELFSGLNYSTFELNNPSEVNKDILFTPFYESITNNKKFFPKFDPNGYDTLDEMLNGVKKHINNNDTSFSYVYWDEPDHVLHLDGANGSDTIKMLNEIDNSIKNFSKDLKDTIVIITADHGHIDCEGLVLQDYPELLNCLKRLPSIEPRCINMFVKDNMDKQLIKECMKFEDSFDLYTKEEFLNSNFFNKGKKHFKVNEFLGDYILIAKGNKFFLGGKPTLNSDTSKYKSMHAGGTNLEMEIPLIIIE